MRFLVYLLTMTIPTASCKKDTGPYQEVEIYVLQNFSQLQGKCQVDPSSATLQTSPAIENDEIIAYSKTSYEFRLTDIGFQKIKAFTDWTPFAVTVDRNVIYYGFFKPPISSSSCDNSITMDIASTTHQVIGLHLGYPGGMSVGIDDQRNNATLIAALEKQGKLR